MSVAPPQSSSSEKHQEEQQQQDDSPWREATFWRAKHTRVRQVHNYKYNFLTAMQNLSCLTLAEDGSAVYATS